MANILDDLLYQQRPTWYSKWVRDERKKGGNITSCDVLGNRVVLTPEKYAKYDFIPPTHKGPQDRHNARKGGFHLPPPDWTPAVGDNYNYFWQCRIHEPAVDSLPNLPISTPPGVMVPLTPEQERARVEYRESKGHHPTKWWIVKI